MAESGNNNTWFGSWLNAAKNKSTEVLEFVKKDLEEFGSAVKNEASNVVNSTGSVIEKTLKLDSPDSTASTMKRSFSSFLGQMNTVLNPSPDDSDTETILIVENSEAVTLTKLQQAIYNLQKNEDSFTSDPQTELKKQFECWLEIVDEQLSTERLEKHLQSSTILREQYAKLVPDKVPHEMFWKRYLFRKALLEDDLAREEAMTKREEKEKLTTEDNVKWENEEISNDVQLSEEEQIQLLEQYEQETKSMKPQSENVPTPQTSPKRPTKKVMEVKKTESSNTPSSNSSTDGDWEKISDIEK